jgi:1-acyl-sn-glycerol-3-phosphate acyltransferase
MPIVRLFQHTLDFLITVLLWFYFLFGYWCIFLFIFVPTWLFAQNFAAALQYLNHVHLKCFFALTRLLIPHTKFVIPSDVRDIRSSVIVCNHLSYLDPILLISLYKRQCTIVKNTFFSVPIFGWFLRKACYVPSSPAEMMGAAMINNLEAIKEHLVAGGNLFVFPEGTRSRDGKLSPFNKGVFSIARYCNAPLKLIFISNTDKLFRPGTFSFNTHDHQTIELELIGSLSPDYKAPEFSISDVASEIRHLFEKRIETQNKSYQFAIRH